MRGIKRPCRLVVVTVLKSNGIIATLTGIGDYESITRAEQVLQAKKSDALQIDEKVIYSQIIPDKVKE